MLVRLLRITERTEHDENANYQDSTRRQARERCTWKGRLGCEEPQEKADNRLGWSLDIPSLGSDIAVANMEIQLTESEMMVSERNHAGERTNGGDD